MVIFVDLVAKQKERLLQHESRLDLNSFDIVVDAKFKLHAYLFSIFSINRNIFIKILKIFVFIKNKLLKNNKIL